SRVQRIFAVGHASTICATSASASALTFLSTSGFMVSSSLSCVSAARSVPALAGCLGRGAAALGASSCVCPLGVALGHAHEVRGARGAVRHHVMVRVALEHLEHSLRRAGVALG